MPRVWGRGLMFGLDSDIGGSALRLWVAAGSAALLVFVCALAIDWTRTRTVARVSVVIVGALLGATLAWTFLNGANVRDLGVERRAPRDPRGGIECPGAGSPASPLACLDGLAGDNVETACERALFATPATSPLRRPMWRRGSRFWPTSRPIPNAAAAISTAPCCRSAAGSRPTASALSRIRWRRATAAPATIARRCRCLQDPGRVRANLSGDTLGRYLDHYITAWAQSPGVPVADGAPPMRACRRADDRRRSAAAQEPHAQCRFSRQRIPFPPSAS